mmetsp:Transcript_34008/g.87944  ORF Transcript_34008/g.87944 Transcript_34008/m.87944 type:complete len:157 (+) Transcript_34008:61-531(+)
MMMTMMMTLEDNRILMTLARRVCRQERLAAEADAARRPELSAWLLYQGSFKNRFWIEERRVPDAITPEALQGPCALTPPRPSCCRWQIASRSSIVSTIAQADWRHSCPRGLRRRCGPSGPMLETRGCALLGSASAASYASFGICGSCRQGTCDGCA